MIRVFNIASFIPIQGFPPENDISLKIYADLRNAYGVDCTFVKPVGLIPFLLGIFKKSLLKRRKIINQKNYKDPSHNISVHFFKCSLPLINKLPINKFKFIPIEYKLYGKSLQKLVRTYNPHVLHSHNLFPGGYFVKKISSQFKIPYFLTIRGSYSELYQTQAAISILENASEITTPSFSLYKELTNKYPIKLIPHGIENDWFSLQKKQLNSKFIHIVTTARLLEMKNIQVVLKALAKLKTTGASFEYNIIGNGPFERNLKELIENLGLKQNVKLWGWQSPQKIREVYKNCEVFIMLSSFETFGRAYFEAAASGLLVIGTKNTGAHGYLEEEDGFFIEPEENKLFQILKELDSKTFIEKTKNAKEKVILMRNEKVIEEYYQIICKVAGQND